MADEDLVRAERVSVGASAGWLGDPLPPAGSDELTLHADESLGGVLRSWTNYPPQDVFNRANQAAIAVTTASQWPIDSRNRWSRTGP
jgi:hypothetical protein